MKIFRFMISLIIFGLGVFTLVFCIKTKQQLNDISGLEVIKHITEYPKLFAGYLVTFICFFSAFISNLKTCTSSILLIRILAIILIILSLSGIVLEFIMIK